MAIILNLIIGAFLLVRLALNLEAKPLSIFFVLAYAALFVLLILKSKFFLVAIVAFLILDSLIATYIFSRTLNLGLEYWGTVAINVAVILLAIGRDRILTN